MQTQSAPICVQSHLPAVNPYADHIEFHHNTLERWDSNNQLALWPVPGISTLIFLLNGKFETVKIITELNEHLIECLCVQTVLLLCGFLRDLICLNDENVGEKMHLYEEEWGSFGFGQVRPDSDRTLSKCWKVLAMQ